MNYLTFPRKAIRAAVIKEYVTAAGYGGVVCFSCGNASRELKKAGLYVVDISPSGDLIPNRWWTSAEIHKVFPLLFNATSGYLNIELMTAIGTAFKDHLGNLSEDCYNIATGSGETIVCLKLAYPDKRFIAHYNVVQLETETRYNPGAPLNGLVTAIEQQL